jgi:hypothetical protein
VSPVPVRFARQMGADAGDRGRHLAGPEGNPTGDPFKMLLQTFAIMGKSINRLELRDADVVLRPALAGMSGPTSGARTRAWRPAAQRRWQQAAMPALRRASPRSRAEQGALKKSGPVLPPGREGTLNGFRGYRGDNLPDAPRKRGQAQ